MVTAHCCTAFPIRNGLQRLVPSPAQSCRWAIDVKWLVKKAIADGKKIPPLYVTCGEEDMLYEINTEFKDYLKENGVDVTWVSVPGYTHEWRFWNLAVEEFLKWIPRTDGYAAGGKRQI